jgi:hypothetical protein
VLRRTGGSGPDRVSRPPAAPTCPPDAFAGFCGQLGVGWVILDAGDAQANGLLERSHRFMRTNFEPGRRFANPLDFQRFSATRSRVSPQASTMRTWIARWSWPGQKRARLGHGTRVGAAQPRSIVC